MVRSPTAATVTMTDNFDAAMNMAHAILATKGVPEENDIQDAVNKVHGISEFAAVDGERLRRALEAAYSVLAGAYSVLDDDQYHPWWADRRSEIELKFWRRYERYLRETIGIPPRVISRLDEVTNVILDHLRSPRETGRWDRRGLVVGEVQSGKTSNYAGLICKAVDAGYKLVIILAGVHNSLRSQTQLRIDEGFLGFDTRQFLEAEKTNQRIGVGALKGEGLLVVNSLTSSAETGDFNRRVASSTQIVPGGEDPLVLVVKKNVSVLRNLVSWALAVRGEEDPTGQVDRIIPGVPLLLIDDEADYASVNTNDYLDENGNVISDNDPTTTNRLIRQLLRSFEQSCYVGYTATPFANVFIHHEGMAETAGEDLFPRSFIINLRTPTNYIGPVQLFGIEGRDEGPEVEGLPLIRDVLDTSEVFPPRHGKHLDVDRLPDSLREAMLAFILSCAVRRVRGHGNAHNSMLVHVTRFTRVQAQVAELVREELRHLKRLLEFGPKAGAGPLLDELRRIWTTDFEPTTTEISRLLPGHDLARVTWGLVKLQLHSATARIEVRQINGSAKDALDYHDNKKGLSVIAIGGDKLSRGLTLEGLTVSYFIRTSRMYDTLMQMGRWFGYRPGYVDLSRLYTSPELVDWYRHIVLATQELRAEFDEMMERGATPLQFGLRVLTHPDGLLVTNATKMRASAKTRIGYAGTITESVAFDLASEAIASNHLAFEHFLGTLGQADESRGAWIWKDASGESVASLFGNVSTPPASWKAQSSCIANFIRQQLVREMLTNWTVALVATGRGRAATISGHEVRTVIRGKSKASNQHLYRIGRLVNPPDETIDLSEDQRAAAMEETERIWVKNGGFGKRPDRPGGREIRAQRSPRNGLLLIYPIDLENGDPDTPPLMGFALSFPRDSEASDVEYAVNRVYWEREFD